MENKFQGRQVISMMVNVLCPTLFKDRIVKQK